MPSRGFRVAVVELRVSSFECRVQWAEGTLRGGQSEFDLAGFGFQVPDFGLQVSGFGFQVLDFGFWVSGRGLPVHGLRCRIECVGCCFQGSGFQDSRVQVEVSEFLVEGVGVEVSEFGVWRVWG